MTRGARLSKDQAVGPRGPESRNMPDEGPSETKIGGLGSALVISIVRSAGGRGVRSGYSLAPALCARKSKGRVYFMVGATLWHCYSMYCSW